MINYISYRRLDLIKDYNRSYPFKVSKNQKLNVYMIAYVKLNKTINIYFKFNILVKEKLTFPKIFLSFKPHLKKKYNKSKENTN